MSDERDNEEARGFSVKDKRRFTPEGQERPEGEEDRPGEGYTPPPETGDRACAEPPAGYPKALPEIDFSTFVLSLSTSAMIHLGEAPDPDGQTRKDLQLAKQTIDILGMIQKKTQGNLSDEEDRLLCDLLYDLRLRYVAASK